MRIRTTKLNLDANINPKLSDVNPIISEVE